MKTFCKTLTVGWVLAALLLGFVVSGYSVGAAAADHSADIRATHLTQPVNPNASQESINLLAYLYSLSDSRQMVIGQFDISTCDLEWNNIREQFGQEPGLYSNRYVLQNDASMQFTNVDAANELLTAHYQDGALLLVHADGFEALDHLVKLGLASGRYEDEAGMVAELDAANPERNMEMYHAWMTYLAHYLEALRDLESRGVRAYMVRPFVESNTKAFFGTNEEDHAHFVRVYRQFVEQFQQSGLTGWLMTYSPGCWADDTFDRYPGNEWLDVLGVTMYSDNQYDGLTAFDGDCFWDYDWFVQTGKPIGLTELSCRHGRVDQPAIRATWMNTLYDIQTYWPRVTWVNCWSGGNFSLQNSSANGDLAGGTDDGKSFMNSPFSLLLEDLPDYRSGQFTLPGVVQLYPEKNRGGAYVGLEERLYTQAELVKLGITTDTVGSFHISSGFSVTFYTGDNGTGKYWAYGRSVNDAAGFTGGETIRSLEVRRQYNVALEKPAITASHNDAQAYKANDGQPSRWSCEAESAWLMLDLEEGYTISRYTVRHAGYAGEVALYNTADFQLQYSVDGVNWITADTVTGNTQSVTSRTVQTFTARYVRLYITKPNSAAGSQAHMVSIAELELYGMRAGQTYAAPSEDPSQPADEPEPDAEPIIDTQPEEGMESDTEQQPEETTDPVVRKRRTQKTVTTQTPFPWWGWVLIAAGTAAAGIGLWFLLLRRRRRTGNGQ